MASFTFNEAGIEHAILMTASFATSGIVSPRQAIECRRVMEELMHPQVGTQNQAQAMLSVKETMQRTGYTFANDETIKTNAIAVSPDKGHVR